jgi:predicted metal-binding membrane protein
LAANGWILGAVVLVAAGAFQFSRLKYRCLDQCRSPLGFLARHWRGRRPSWDALRLGAHHGAFCVGCCWAMMLLMFVVGTGNVDWMLALGAIMAVEKNIPSGRRLSRPLGVALVAWGVIIVAVNTAGL